MKDHTLTKIKMALRRNHSLLDEDIRADIEGCLADLRAAGIINPDDADPLIYNAIKLWCKANNEDDIAKSTEYLRRYEALRGALQMAEGYGWIDDTEEAAADE